MEEHLPVSVAAQSKASACGCSAAESHRRAWMSVCCVSSGRGLCDELITRPEKSSLKMVHPVPKHILDALSILYFVLPEDGTPCTETYSRYSVNTVFCSPWRRYTLYRNIFQMLCQYYILFSLKKVHPVPKHIPDVLSILYSLILCIKLV
jgi:hypothetical protein